MRHVYPGSHPRPGDILSCLLHSSGINVDCRHEGLRITLSHHHGYYSRTCPHIEDSGTALSPGPQQHTIRTHLHGTAVLMNYELLELEHF